MASCAVRIFDRLFRGHTVQVVVVARPRKNGKIGNADENNGDFRPTLVIFDRFWVKKKPACFCACQCVCVRACTCSILRRASRFLCCLVAPVTTVNTRANNASKRAKNAGKIALSRSLSSSPFCWFFAA